MHESGDAGILIKCKLAAHKNNVYGTGARERWDSPRGKQNQIKFLSIAPQDNILSQVDENFFKRFVWRISFSLSRHDKYFNTYVIHKSGKQKFSASASLYINIYLLETHAHTGNNFFHTKHSDSARGV